MPPDGLKFAAPTPLQQDDGLDWADFIQPPSVPPDPIGDDWRGPPGPQGPPGVGGITDAPTDGVTYGRVSAAWRGVLPLTGGTLTGGVQLPPGTAANPSLAFAAGTGLSGATASVIFSTAGAGRMIVTDTDVLCAVPLDLMSHTITSLADPVYPNDALNLRTGDARYAVAGSGVVSFNTRVGPVVLSSADVTTALTFTPYNATNPQGFQTAAQVTTSLLPYAPLASPTFTGVPAAPTAAPGTNSTQIASTGFVSAAVAGATAGVASFNTRTGIVTLSNADVTTVLPASSTTPPMDGTAAVGTGTTWARADHIHPSDTSRYSATNPSGFQTAAQVTAALPVASSTLPGMDGAAAIGAGTTWARADHVHPSDTSRAPLASPTFTGVPAAPTVAPTAAVGTGQLATTAFVRNGTTTSDNALAGQVGEYLSATRLIATQITLTSNTVQDILALSLTVGDWDVNGNIVLNPDGACLVTAALCWITTASVSQPVAPNNGGDSYWVGNPLAGSAPIVAVGPTRIVLGATTVIYLSCRNQFSAGQCFGYGFLGARRAR